MARTRRIACPALRYAEARLNMTTIESSISTKYPAVRNYIGGEFVGGDGDFLAIGGIARTVGAMGDGALAG